MITYDVYIGLYAIILHFANSQTQLWEILVAAPSQICPGFFLAVMHVQRHQTAGYAHGAAKRALVREKNTTFEIRDR